MNVYIVIENFFETSANVYITQQTIYLYFSNLDHSVVSRVTIPDTALIQFALLKMSIIVLQTCRGV